MSGKKKFIIFGVLLIIILFIFGGTSGYYLGSKAPLLTVPVGMLVGVFYTQFSMDRGWI